MNNDFPATLTLRHGPVTAVDLALFAAASGDHNPLHLDAAVAAKAGFERPVVHGMFTMACAARLFTRHFGAGHLRQIDTRFTGAALLGDTLVFEATLLETIERTARYSLAARTEGGAPLVAGTATVAAP